MVVTIERKRIVPPDYLQPIGANVHGSAPAANLNGAQVKTPEKHPA